MGYKGTTARSPWLSWWEEPGLFVHEERGGAGGRWHKIFGAVQNQVAEWGSRSVWAGGAHWGSPRPSGDEPVSCARWALRLVFPILNLHKFIRNFTVTFPRPVLPSSLEGVRPPACHSSGSLKTPETAGLAAVSAWHGRAPVTDTCGVSRSLLAAGRARPSAPTRPCDRRLPFLQLTTGCPPPAWRTGSGRPGETC